MPPYTKWYPLLNRESQENKTSQSLLTYVVPSVSNLIVSREIETKREWAVFYSYYEFYNYMMKSVSKSHRCFYEYIFGNLPQKVYFDLDISLEDTDLTRDEGKLVLIEILERILRLFPCIKKRDIMIFNSHGETKISYHIIVDRWFVPSASVNKAFFHKIMEGFPERYKIGVDHGMFKSAQAFRMYNCHKWGKRRYKELDEMSEWVPSISPADLVHANFLEFMASLISNTTYCEILPVQDIVATNKRKFYELDFADENIEKAMELCAKYEETTVDDLPYRFCNTKNNLILLKRTKASYCKTCQRIHENQHPFLCVKKGAVYYNCFRNADNITTYIGNIDVDMPEFDLDICGEVYHENENIIIEDEFSLNGLQTVRTYESEDEKEEESSSEEEDEDPIEIIPISEIARLRKKESPPATPNKPEENKPHEKKEEEEDIPILPKGTIPKYELLDRLLNLPSTQAVKKTKIYEQEEISKGYNNIFLKKKVGK